MPWAIRRRYTYDADGNLIKVQAPDPGRPDRADDNVCL